MLGGLAGAMGGLGQAMGGREGIINGLSTVSPLLMAMSAGLASGKGAMAGLPLGLAQMTEQQKLRAAEAEKLAARSSYGSWNTGDMTMGSQGPSAGVPGGPPANVAPPGYRAPMGGSFAELFPQVEQQFRLPGGYLERTAQLESGGNPTAANPNSSARGLFQFIDSTASQYGVDPSDPVSSTWGAGKLAADNRNILVRTLGREPTGGELYLAHQQGGGGAAALLSNPSAPAASIVGADAVRLNGGDQNMTAGDFAQKWIDKFGRSAGPVDPRRDPAVKGMIRWLAQHGEADPAMAAAARAELDMRLQYLSQASEGKGLTDAQAAQLGLEEARMQPGPVSPQDRYQSVQGVGLVDLYAPGGPRPVLSGPVDPMSGAGKLKADLDAGRITQEQFDVEMSRGNISFTTNPDGTTSFSMGSGDRLKPLTEGQSKDNFYLASIDHAGPILDQYETALVGLSGAANDAAGLVPVIGKFMQSEDYQVAKQAVSEWGAPVLRKESGAALTREDYSWLESRYIPVPGEKPEVIAKKREARKAAEAGLRSGMTEEQINSVARALKGLRPDLTFDQRKGIATETAGYTNAPSIGAVVEGYRYAGGDPGDPSSWVKQ